MQPVTVLSRLLEPASQLRWPRVVLAALLVCTLTAAAPAQKPVAQLPQVYIDTTWNPPVGGTTWAAHTSAQFSSALSSSAPGDTILLDAGMTYSGNFYSSGEVQPE